MIEFHGAATEVFRDELHDALRSEWPAPFASNVTPQIARKIPVPSGIGDMRPSAQLRIPSGFASPVFPCAAFFFTLFLSLSAAAASTLIATRVWPALEYTRVTFEAREPIKSQFMTLKNPERLVVDLENIDLSAELTELAKRVRDDDPYIKLVRVARFKPNVVRVVIDLKTEVKPAVFPLAPVGEYQHRLVLDIYPAKPIDPLLALLSVGEGREPVSLQMAPALPLADPIPDAGREIREASKAQGKTEGPPDAKAESVPQQLAVLEKVKKPALGTLRMITVAVDAGHGGEDPGARGRRGTREKQVTLSIARKVKSKLDAESGVRAVLTRDGDYFIPLQNRVVKARRVQADLFVSIHADAFMQSQANGSSVFALSERGATSAAARWLAQRENEADLIGGVNFGVKDPYLARTLLDLSQTATINDSLKLGRAVLGELGGINHLHKASVEQAGFAVLKAPDIPSILVETAFISNLDEESRLNDPGYQDKIAEAIVSGIKLYFAKNPPLARTRVALREK